MLRFAICILFLAILAFADDSASFYFFRPLGQVAHEDGVPMMNITVTADASESENLKKTMYFLAKSTQNTGISNITGYEEVSISPNREHFFSGDEGKRGSDSQKGIDDSILNNIPAAKRAFEGWYAAGFAEGYTTMSSITNVIAAREYTYSDGGKKWVDAHLAYLKSGTVDTSPRNLSPFWVQIQKQVLQMYGIADGYNARVIATGANHPPITFETVLKFNLLPEYDEFEKAAKFVHGDEQHEVNEVSGGSLSTSTKAGSMAPPQNKSHSSLLIKVTSDDILFGHVSASSYTSLVGRQRKTYVMETAVTMTTNAIMTHAGARDGWYQTSQKLAVASVGFSNMLSTHYRHMKPKCVTALMRAMAANYLASTGREWLKVFSVNAAGTMSAQWAIVDYKLYTKGMPITQLPDSTLWLIEEMPGLMASFDHTAFLRHLSYFAAYNIPYDKDIYASAGYIGASIDNGDDFYSHGRNPRARIFKRDHELVLDLDRMKALMHYNDWKNDDLSTIPNCPKCSPARSPLLGIAPRADLVPTDASFEGLEPNHAQLFAFNFYGAVDAKVTNYDGMVYFRDLSAAAVVYGPTADRQPAFSWDNYPDHPYGKLEGMPQKFSFPWNEGAAPSHPIPAEKPQTHHRSYSVDVLRVAGKPIVFDADGVPRFDLEVRLRTPNASDTKEPSDKKEDALTHLTTAKYNETGLVTGFDTLDVSAASSALFASEASALATWYAAGYAEGYATAEAIGVIKVWRNYTYTAGTLKWVDAHLKYMRTNALTKASPFWKQVRKQLLQLHGIADGVNAWHKDFGNKRILDSFKPMTFLDVFMINFRDDNDDVIAIATAPKEVREELRRQREAHRGDHCSAMIKVVYSEKDKDGAPIKPVDVLLGQATWASYAIMIHRQIKTYLLEHTVTFSCNAGMIFSGDDWYQTSHKLGVQETTNEFKNPDLYDLIKPECVSYFMRVMIANYLARNAKEWVELYSQEPAGTYCNQWMIFDYKRFQPDVPRYPFIGESLMILEEIPGLIESADMTPFLRDNGYWASYNVPYFSNIANASGFTEYYEKYGDFYSWEKTPRANIFRRNQSHVKDVDSLRALLRYNNWENDELSAIPNCTDCVPKNSPICAIAARADLVPKDAFINVSKDYRQKLERGIWGAPDVKIGAYSLINDGFASSNLLSPSNINLPTFGWNAHPENPLGFAPGAAQYYAYSPIEKMRPSLPEPNPEEKSTVWYVYRVDGDGVPAPTTSLPNITFVVLPHLDEAHADKFLASAHFNKTNEQIGLDQLTVAPNPTLFTTRHPLQGWYATGIAEGYATMQEIKDFIAVANYSFPMNDGGKSEAFIVQQLAYLRAGAEDRETKLKEAYWRQVRKQLLQMEGIAAGFNRRAEDEGETMRITMEDVFRINLLNEKDDIHMSNNYLQPYDPLALPRRQWKINGGVALIKAVKNEIIFGHNTGASYRFLVGRMYKTYRMENSRMTVSMTSNAGLIFSGDEWYITSRKFAIMKSAHDIYEPKFEMYSIVKSNSVPTFMRTMIAIYLAESPTEWADTFARYISGTYGGQFMILDYNRYEFGTAAADLEDGVLTIVEHVANFCKSSDQTAELRKSTYWASVGIPFDENVYELAGYEAMMKEFQQFFDRKLNPRVQLIADKQATFVDFGTLQSFMRSNDYVKQDAKYMIPFCQGCIPQQSPLIAMSPRGDLIPSDRFVNYNDRSVVDPRYGVFFLQQGAYGTIDHKITSSILIDLFSSYVHTGPTIAQGKFSWRSARYEEIRNDPLSYASGMTQTFSFFGVSIGPNDGGGINPPNPPTPAPHREEDPHRSRKLVIGIIVACIFIVVNLGAIIYGFLSKVERRDLVFEEGSPTDAAPLTTRTP